MTRGTYRIRGLALALLVSGAPARPVEAEAVRPRPAVVIELFTSQGCASCPAADRVLSKLGRERRAGEVTLVPLAYHVDYWNRIGWVDPFSSPHWSARQRRYAAAFGLRSVYTPQVVLNGRAELVGSYEGRLRAEIPAAVPPDPAGRVEILAAALDESGAELVVDLAAAVARPDAAPRLVAYLALFESGLVTRVETGENAHRTLEHDHVVRLLQPALLFEPGSVGRQQERVRLELAAEWVVANLGLAVFLQDAETLEIHSAAVLESLPAISRSR